MKRFPSLLGALFALIAAALVVTPSAAQASGMTWQVTNYDHDGTRGVYLRHSPNLSDVARIGANYLTYGTWVRFTCYRWGTAVGSHANRVWHQVTVVSGPNTGHGGWLSDHWVNDPATANHPLAGEPQCGITQPQPAPAPAPPAAGFPSRIGVATALDWCPGHAAICQDNGDPDYRDPLFQPPRLAAGTAVRMECWVDGRTVPGYKYPRWFYVTVSTGRTGFVKAETVTESTQTRTPNCSSLPAVNASLWATGVDVYGQRQPTPAMMRQMRDTYPAWRDSKWGPNRDWSGDCVSFVVLAWLDNGPAYKITNYGAAEMRTRYGGDRLPRTTPPRGALVFWPYRNLGHVALSLGNGVAVTTSGIDTPPNGLKPIGVRATQATPSAPGNAGWVMPFH